METPSISSSVGYTSSTVPLLYTGQNVSEEYNALIRSKSPVANIYAAAHQINEPTPTTKEDTMAVATTRVVKVYIADPNENLALQDQLIFSGPEKLTDSTNEELFFELNFGELLAAHNEKRKATIDKKQSEKFGRQIFLEPIRIRDLKMVVAAIAEFK